MARHRGKKGRAARILVDMDGVLCDFEGYFLQRYREQFPEAPYVPLEDRRTFYLGDQYREFGREVVANIRKITESKGFYRNMPPLPDAIDALKDISGMENVEVFICTSQLSASCHCAQEKFEWIQEHLGKDWAARVIITKDKTIIAGDLLIDDKPKIKGVEMVPTWKQILFTSCSNKHLDISRLQSISRLDSWADTQHWKQLIEDCRKRLS